MLTVNSFDCTAGCKIVSDQTWRAAARLMVGSYPSSRLLFSFFFRRIEQRRPVLVSHGAHDRPMRHPEEMPLCTGHLNGAEPRDWVR